MTKKATDPSADLPDDDLAAKVRAAQAGDDQIAELEAKITELNAMLTKSMEIAARAQAELQNAKIRMEREAAELRTFASEATLKKLIPTIDNLQRALKHLPADIAGHEWVKGIVATEQEFFRQVGDMGLTRFDQIGGLVDSSRHEVLMAVPGDADTVMEVIEAGYELHGKILRPAKVKVGSVHPK